MDESSEFFWPEKALETANFARIFLVFYQRLAQLNRLHGGEDLRNYKITPKFHSMTHLADYVQQTRRNPRFFAILQKVNFSIRLVA